MSNQSVVQVDTNEQTQAADAVLQAKRESLQSHEKELNEREHRIKQEEDHRSRPIADNHETHDSRQFTPTQIMDAKIDAATDVEKIKEFVKLRGELQKQELEKLDAEHKQSLENRKTAEKFLLTPALVAVGIWLLFSGFAWIGGILIGAGLYILVPEFVIKYMEKVKDNTTSSGGTKSGESK